MAGGVQGLIDGWQARLPAAYESPGIEPNPGSLAAWMQKMMDSAGGLKLTRARPADPYTAAERYLRDEGVDVAAGLRAAGHNRRCGEHVIRAAAGHIRDLALDLKIARRKLLAEARGVNEGAQGFSRSTLGAAEDRVSRLEAALSAACFDDAGLVRAACRGA